MIHLILASLMLFAPAEDVDLLYAVPPNAQLVVSARSIGELEQTLKESAWGRFLGDDEMKEWVELFMSALGVEKTLELGPLTPMKLYQSIGGGIAGYLRVEGKDVGGAAVMVAPGDKRDAFDEYLTALKQRLLDSEAFTDSIDAYGDADILILEPKGEDTKDPCLFLAEEQDVVAFVVHPVRETGLEMTQSIYEAFKGEGEDESILDVPAFQEARERLQGPGDLEVYFDMGALLSVFPVEEAPDFLGMDAFSYVYKTAKVGRGEKLDVSAFIGIEGEGMVRDLVDCFMEGTSLDLLSFIPSEATGAQALFMDINGIYKRVMEELLAQSEEEYQQFRKTYDEMVVQTLKIDPEKEILERLDGRIATFTIEVPEEEYELMNSVAPGLGMMTSQSLGSYGFMYLLGIKDAQAFQADFEKMLRALGVYVTLKKEEFQGQIIYSIQAPMGGLRLYWVFSEDVIGLSIFPSPVRAYLRMRAHGDQPTIEDRDEFADFIRNNRSVSAISMARTSDTVYSILSALQTVVNMMTSFTAFESEKPIKPPSLPLPDKKVIEKYFKGIVGYVMNVDEEGIYLKFVTE
jgi:hypothetical protein